MKKLMTTIGLGMVIALSSVTFAQDGPQKGKKITKEERKNMTAEEKAKHKTDRMTKQLALSEDQAKQVFDVNLEYEKDIKVLRAEAKKIKEDIKVKRTVRRTDIEKVLTAEQLAKVKELEAKRKEKHQNKGGEHGKKQSKK